MPAAGAALGVLVPPRVRTMADVRALHRPWCVAVATGLLQVGEGMVIPSYTSAMKTAISLPEDTFEQATKQAAELGISRSEFFARAARRYLDDLAARSLTQQIDEALKAAGPDDSATAAAAAGRSRLGRQEDW